MVCPRCGSENVRVQIVTDVKTTHRGCFGWLCWILLAICTLGLIIIIPLITNSKTESHSHAVAVCQNCGHRWRGKKGGKKSAPTASQPATNTPPSASPSSPSKYAQLLRENVPCQVFTLIGNGNDSMQECVSMCTVGDAVGYVRDRDNGKYLASDGGSIGYFPAGADGLLDFDGEAFVSEVGVDGSKKHFVRVAVFER